MKQSKLLRRIITLTGALVVAATACRAGVKPQVKAQNTYDSGVTHMESNISEMNLKGYVGTNVRNNIKFWQRTAYKNNKNIVGQIARANSIGDYKSFSDVLGNDFAGVDSYYDIDIVPYGESKALGFTLKKMPSSFGDRDITFCRDDHAVIDWSGAKELWVNVDASEVPSPFSLRLTFEENYVGRETFALINGATVYIYDGGVRTAVKVETGGFVPLPAGFKGVVALPLNYSTFYCYFNSGGNGSMDLSVLAQIIMCIKGTAPQIGKTIYIDDFSIVGNVNGVTPPYQATDEAYTYKTVWDFEWLAPRDGYTASDLWWYGEFVGKLLTGMAFCYKIEPDQELKAAAEEIITDLEAAQGEDGYLGVFTGGARFSISTANWDLWNHYHCVVGLLEWYKLTGSEKALGIATRTLDLIYDTFKNRSYLVAGGFETNRSIAHAYALAYQVTHDKRYILEAERIITQDCQDGNGWYKCALFGRHYYTSSSARWETLHMIMTLGILYEETGKREYYDVMSAVWEDILMTDVHNDGGFTTNECALGDPYLEGIIETCCTVAWMAFTNEYYKYNKTVAVADELERSYYNAMLGALLDDDKYCTYNTPMNGEQGTAGSYDGRRVPSQQDISFQYNPGSPDFNCCQANLARGLGQVVEWACVTDGESLYLNYYGNSSIKTTVGDSPVRIKETTTYPVSGSVKLEISELAAAKEFTLKLRIPTWAKGSRVTVDGKATVVTAGEYYPITRVWNNGDTVTLDLNMDVHYWTNRSSTSIDLSIASVYYGPVLLTMDSTYGGTKTTLFTADGFENATITSGTSYGCMLFAEVDTDDGSTVKLVDFASAGKYNGKSQPSTYYTWLKVFGAPTCIEDDAHARWNNTDKHYVLSEKDITIARRGWYAGETVEFMPAAISGKKLGSVDCGNVTVTESNGKFSFVMGDEDVTVRLTYVDDEGTPDEPTEVSASAPSSEVSSEKSAVDKAEGGSGCGGVGTGIAGAAIVAGAAAITLKRRKNRT